jgi:hypothetical protein
MSDPNFGHDGNSNSLDDLLDHLGVTLEREKSRRAHGSSTTMHGDEASHLPYARHRLWHGYLQVHALVP